MVRGHTYLNSGHLCVELVEEFERRAKHFREGVLRDDHLLKSQGTKENVAVNVRGSLHPPRESNICLEEHVSVLTASLLAL